MEPLGRPDILEDVRDRLAGRPPKERPKAIGRADVVSAQEEFSFRRQRNQWEEVSCSGEKNLPELDPVSDHDGVVVPILVRVVAKYVYAVTRALCDDVLVPGVPNPIEVVEIVQAFPWWLAQDLHARYDLGTSLLCWDAVVAEPQYPKWAKDEAIQGPIDAEIFVFLVCGFGKSPEESVSDLITRKIDRFWEDHARTLSEFMSSEPGIGRESISDNHFGPPPSAGNFPKRAAWLKDRLHERGWSKHDLEGHNGPAHKTTQKVLDGDSVRADVLEKIAAALSRKLRPVAIADIPQN